MRTKILRVTFLICMVFPSVCHASRLHSFVVGINNYKYLPAHRQLSNSINDAVRVSDELNILGYSGKYELNITRSKFYEKWQVFIDDVGKGDTVVLFFSGHGIEIEGENYFLPSDVPYIEYGRQERLKRESLSIDEIVFDLRSREPSVLILILDACRDNPMIPSHYKSLGGKQGGLAKMDAPEGTFIMYSSESNGVSLDRLPEDKDQNRNSVYTRMLLPLFREKNLPIQNLARKLRRNVRLLASGIGHVQRPAYYDGLDGKFCFGGCDQFDQNDSVSLSKISHGNESLEHFEKKNIQPQIVNSKLIQFIFTDSDKYNRGDELKIKIRAHSSNVSAFAIFEPYPRKVQKIYAQYSTKEGGVYIKYTLPSDMKKGKHDIKVYIQELGTRYEEQVDLQFHVE